MRAVSGAQGTMQDGRPRWPWWLAGTLLAASGALLIWSLWGQLGEPIALNSDFWFQADTGRVFDNLTKGDSARDRSSVHPLFLLFVAMPTIWTIKLFGLAPIEAVRVEMAVVAAVAVASLFVLLVRMSLPLLDAVIFTCVFLSSSVFVFWFSVPETYAAGALSIFVVFLVLLSRSGNGGYVVAIVASFAMTITNVVPGLAATWLSWPWRRAAVITALGAMAVAALVLIQLTFFPYSTYLELAGERGYLASDIARRAPERLLVMSVGSIVIPSFRLVSEEEARSRIPLLLVQPGPGGFATPAGGVAALSWIALLGLGVWSALEQAGLRPLRGTILVALLAQVCLHLVYGDDTFTYVAHFAPYLVVLAAFTSRTKARVPGLALAVAVTVFGWLNNRAVFAAAVATMHQMSAAGRL